MTTIKEQKRNRRHRRIRAKVAGDIFRPRLSVYRSNRYIYAQIIDDEKGETLVSASDHISQKKNIGKSDDKISKKIEQVSKSVRAKQVGVSLAEIAKKKQINKVVFDRGGFLYAGRIKALSEGVREGGLEF